MSRAQRIVFFVSNDAHAAPADLQSEHNSGHSMTGFSCLRVWRFIALPGHGKSSVGFGPYRKTNP
jgi:hypothetical protein